MRALHQSISAPVAKARSGDALAFSASTVVLGMRLFSPPKQSRPERRKRRTFSEADLERRRQKFSRKSITPPLGPRRPTCAAPPLIASRAALSSRGAHTSRLPRSSFKAAAALRKRVAAASDAPVERCNWQARIHYARNGELTGEEINEACLAPCWRTRAPFERTTMRWSRTKPIHTIPFPRPLLRTKKETYCVTSKQPVKICCLLFHSRTLHSRLT